MLSYQKLSRRPQNFQSFTGLSVAQFDNLYKKIKQNYANYQRERLARADRQRTIGGGRKFKLSMEDRILMALVYYRLYITYTTES